MESQKEFQVGVAENRFPLILLFIVCFPLVFEMGDIFEECKSKLFPIGKVMNQKISFQ